MNIALISAEVSPFAKEGGLSDIASALPKAWQSLGHNAIIILPKYGDIDTDYFRLEPLEITISVPIGYWTEYASLWKTTLPGREDVSVYFIDNQDYFARHGIYGNPDGFEDNDRRFLFLSRASFEVCKAIGFKPDIMHAHDYHTAMVMPFLKMQYRNDPFFYTTAGVLTLHNLAYQGWFNPKKIFELSGWPWQEFYPGSFFEMKGQFNAMKTGIMFADKITTVSPTYANEIRWTEYGEGLQEYLHQRSADLIGVLNGADYEEWSPEKDTHIVIPYSSKNLESKQSNKDFLLRDFQVPAYDLERDIPLVGMVSRLTDQKGIELLEQTIEDFIKYGAIRLAILGSGEKRYEQFFHYLASKYPTRVFVTIGYNNTLSHRIMAGCDYLLIPSRFEPCGLTQIYAMKYGTIPIVRLTGGLADTVQEYNPSTRTGDGFTFNGFRVQEFSTALRKALALYKTEWHWDQIRYNAMKKDLSAIYSAKEYLDVFTWALEKIR
jgi:starch synthase